MTTHKAACIADCLDRSPSGCLYVDADVLFVDRLTAADLAGADIAITPRHPKERSPHHLANGDINAGILYFADSPAARTLLADWEAPATKEIVPTRRRCPICWRGSRCSRH